MEPIKERVQSALLTEGASQLLWYLPRSMDSVCFSRPPPSSLSVCAYCERTELVTASFSVNEQCFFRSYLWRPQTTSAGAGALFSGAPRCPWLRGMGGKHCWVVWGHQIMSCVFTAVTRTAALVSNTRPAVKKPVLCPCLTTCVLIAPHTGRSPRRDK